MARTPWRERQVGTRLSTEEFALVCEIRAATGLTVRDLLLIGVRRAKAQLALERRKHHGNGV
jgi:hypothetical protein